MGSYGKCAGQACLTHPHLYLLEDKSLSSVRHLRLMLNSGAITPAIWHTKYGAAGQLEGA